MPRNIEPTPINVEDLLRQKFESHLAEWKREKPNEFLPLIGHLAAWGAAVGEGRHLWELIESQIDFLARHKPGATPEKIVEELFASPNAGDWMYRLQIP